jgi:predicted lipoprotein with Yx(FWY)xxD motif
MHRVLLAVTAIALTTAFLAAIVIGTAAVPAGEAAAAEAAIPIPAASGEAGAAESGAASGQAGAAESAGAEAAAVGVRRSRFGRVLFDGRGRALYLFTRERSSTPRCYGDCAVAWPPFLTRGKPSALRGVRSSLLGTTRRRDGSRQVTYDGQPLYYYVGDRKPGQILCQDVDEFGGTWLVVAPDGKPVR